MDPHEPILEQLSEASLKRRLRHSRRVRGEFIKGPIPLSWLEQASRLPGKTLAVALALWFRAGVTSSSSGLRLSGNLMARLNIGRKAAYRAVSELERAGLVRVERRVGCRPVMEILQADSRRSSESRAASDSATPPEAGF